MCEVAAPGGVGLRPATVRPARLALEDGLELDSGRRLPRVDIAFETHGTLNADRSNAVLVCPCLTANHHVAGVDEQGATGWWDWLVGPGRPIDTDRMFVVCPSLLGSCTGTTGPTSEDPATGGRYGPRFPAVTIGDMTRAHARLLSALGIARLHTVVGGSIGGMQALEFGARYPGRVERVIAVAAAARLSAQGVAINAIGRRAILTDRGFRGGDYTGVGPAAGLATARQLAHVSYLSRERMDQRFGDDNESVRGYLDHQGEKLVRRFDANAYLRLLDAMDGFRWSGPAGVRAGVSLVSLSSDWLFPSADSDEVARLCAEHGVSAAHRVVESDNGHDGFLIDAEGVGAAVREAVGA